VSDELVVLERCKKDPEWFMREVLGENPSAKQVEIAEAVRDNRVTAVPSCHGSGKSWVAARIALWFCYCHEEAQVITTAPTERQVKGVLWGELHKSHRRARLPLGGESTALQIKLADKHWILGFTAPDWDASRFQGFHAPHVLVVVDEASGISVQLMDQIDSLLSGGHARKLLIGNPVVAGGSFQRDCESPNVKTIPISAWGTPNFQEFGIVESDIIDGSWRAKIDGRPMPYPELISPEWVAERFALWGVDSAAWQARVRGEFPLVIEGAYYGELMKAARAENRIGIVPYDPAYPVGTAWDIGVSDETAIWFYQQVGQRIHLIDYFEASGKGLPYYVKLLKEKPYVYRTEHIAPHDMAEREWGAGARSRIAIAQELGINFRIVRANATRQGSEVAEGIDAVRRILSRCYFDEEKCGDGIWALENYRRKRNRSTGELTDTPEHDGGASHGSDAFRYLSLGLRPVASVARPPVPKAWVI
jgi:hypothetical protein